MEIRFQISEKHDIGRVTEQLAISLTLKMFRVMVVEIDGLTIDLEAIRQDMYRHGVKEINE